MTTLIITIGIISGKVIFTKLWEWSNYVTGWKTGDLSTTYWNSIAVTVATILLILIVSYLAAYSFARFDSRINKILLVVFLAAHMIPGQLLLIPLFKVELLLHIYNTKLGLILPYAADGMTLAIFFADHLHSFHPP